MSNKTELNVLTGGDWKIEGSQSLFYYKVKLMNKSNSSFTNIQIILTSIPPGLSAQTDRYKIDKLAPNSFEAPTFKFKAEESCVGSAIEAIVTYTNPMGQAETIIAKPFEIVYVCNLLLPKAVSKEEFDERVEFMEVRRETIELKSDILDLESQIINTIASCNFALITQNKTSEKENLRVFEAFAHGAYSKEDVALSISIDKSDPNSKVIIKAMSDRGEKIFDLLRDVKSRLQGILNIKNKNCFWL